MDKETAILFRLLSLLCIASLFVMGILAYVLTKDAEKPQEQRIYQLEQKSTAYRHKSTTWWNEHTTSKENHWMPMAEHPPLLVAEGMGHRRQH
jgi:membrane peptidoglycan carboxypeptidase